MGRKKGPCWSVLSVLSVWFSLHRGDNFRARLFISCSIILYKNHQVSLCSNSQSIYRNVTALSPFSDSCLLVLSCRPPRRSRSRFLLMAV